MKDILKQSEKTLAAIVLASTIGLSGCNDSTQRIEVGNYSCMESKVDNILVANPNTTFIVKYDNKKATKRVVDAAKYGEITYKNMTLEEATNALDACEAAIKNYKK